MRSQRGVWAAVLVLSACGSPAPPTVDPDAGAPPGPLWPVMTPCPAGWSSPVEAGSLALCDPWPETGHRPDCPFDQAHFAGRPGCERVGTECAADGWPAALPEGVPVVYVDDDVRGGDGASRATAFTSLTAAVAAAPPGAVIAVATGTYAANGIELSAPVTIVGACVGETRLVTTSSSIGFPAILVSASSVVVRNLSFDAPSRPALVIEGDDVLVEDVVIAGADLLGVNLPRGGAATLRRVVIRDIPPVGGRGGEGIDVRAGARLTLDAIVIERTQYAAIFATDAATEIVGDGVAIHSVAEAPPGSGDFGVGVFAIDGAMVRLSSSVVESTTTSIGALEGSAVELTDVVLRGAAHRAVDVETGSSFTAARLRIDACWEGIHAYDVGSRVELEDAVVRDAVPDGGGAVMIDRGSATIERAYVARVGVVGIAALAGVVEAREVRVLDLRAPERFFGAIGAWAQSGGELTLESATIDGAVFIGAGASEGGTLAVSDVVVRRTAPSACAETTCPDYSGGFGIVAQLMATVRAERFSVEDSALCGVVVGEGSSLDLAHGVIARAPVGACVQASDYDSARLRNDVEYRDVRVPLQATSYELPGLGGS